MLGENGLVCTWRRTPTIEAVLPRSWLPPPCHCFRTGGAEDGIASPAPVEAMAQAGNARVSHDAGRYYCNYSYQSALRAGLNAVFIHVPAGIFGLGRDPEGAAQSVNRMLGAWYRETPERHPHDGVRASPCPSLTPRDRRINQGAHTRRRQA